MKKSILTVVAIVVGFVGFAQNNSKIKYVTAAPDGSIAMTLYDNVAEGELKLESAYDFYKFEILDMKTSLPVYSSDNKGKNCSIDKNEIASGTYKVKLYTSDFVITTAIPIGTTKDGLSLLQASYGDVVTS